MALAHHGFNLALQAPRLVLPVLTISLLSATTNAHFYVAVIIASSADGSGRPQHRAFRDRDRRLRRAPGEVAVHVAGVGSRGHRLLGHLLGRRATDPPRVRSFLCKRSELDPSHPGARDLPARDQGPLRRRLQGPAAASAVDAGRPSEPRWRSGWPPALPCAVASPDVSRVVVGDGDRGGGDDAEGLAGSPAARQALGCRAGARATTASASSTSSESVAADRLSGHPARFGSLDRGLGRGRQIAPHHGGRRTVRLWREGCSASFGRRSETGGWRLEEGRSRLRRPTTGDRTNRSVVVADAILGTGGQR